MQKQSGQHVIAMPRYVREELFEKLEAWMGFAGHQLACQAGGLCHDFAVSLARPHLLSARRGEAAIGLETARCWKIAVQSAPAYSMQTAIFSVLDAHSRT